MSDFDFKMLSNVFEKNRGYTHEDVKKHIWFLNKYLSFDEDSLEIIAFLQKYLGCLQGRLYPLWVYSLPRKQAPFLKYIKTKKSKKEEIINLLSEYLQCSKSDAKEALTILSKDHKEKEILELFGHKSKSAKVQKRKKKK